MEKKYKDLCFTDNFMFCKILANNSDLCRHVLELILGERIKNIHIKTAEQVIDITPTAKSVRLDVYLDDDAGTVYDLEMQTSAKKNLPKRLRYYQDIIDLNLIEKGMNYDRLPKSVIIFICTFDYFDKGLPFYVFENRCEAMPELLMGDDVKKIFVNPYGSRKQLSEEAVHFLDYIQNGLANDPFTKEIEKAVQEAKNYQKWEVEYMNWCAYEMDHNIDKQNARQEGREEERAAGMKQFIQLICKKKAKGWDAKQTAEMFESDVAQISSIYQIIDAIGTTEDVDAIYEALSSQK